MRLFGFNRRRSETLLLALGQLVLIAYVFQVAAFDHWDINISEDVAGVAGTSDHAFHADHCHGAASSCSDAGGGFVHISSDQAPRLPASNPLLALDSEPATPEPSEAPLSPISEPPRALV